MSDKAQQERNAVLAVPVLHPSFMTMATTNLVTSASFLGEDSGDSGFQKADSGQEATSKTNISKASAHSPDQTVWI